MKQNLQQSTIQKLALTANMRASLDLLRMGPDEAAETVEEEAKRNPFLRFVPTIAGGLQGTPDGSSYERPEIADAQTPTDALLQQIALIRFKPAEHELAVKLPYCLDARGFLVDDVDDMCGYLQTDRALLISVIDTLQKSVEPVGVFAVSLQDCFRIQLEAKNRCDPLILKLLDRLDLVASEDWQAICNFCGVDLEDAVEMLADIRLLRPAPLVQAPIGEPATHAPDLLFQANDDGSMTAMLNAAALPLLLTDDGLFKAVSVVETDAAAMSYYRDCYRGAAAIVVAMQKRANTLLRIGQEIAAVQDRYIRTGRPLDRAPLTMGQLAISLGLNKSTVSRAMKNCVALTPNGPLAAAEFLARPLNEENTQRTREQALRRLALMIRTEDRAAPFSDDTLAGQLTKARFPISRRTVAKYRHLLGIPGAYHRRGTVLNLDEPAQVLR